MHDRESFAQAGYEEFLADLPTISDLGYLGNWVIILRRKPRGGELSDGDKKSNGEISAMRSVVERAISHLKNWKILATGYRGLLAELPNVIRIVAALEFYRLGW